MRFLSTAFAVVAAASGLLGLASAAEEKTTPSANPISAPLLATEVTAGKEFTIEWSPTAGDKVTLVLRKGDPGSLELVEIIAKDLPNQGAFIWVPNTEFLGADDYAIQILSETPLTQNYSAKFKIKSSGKGLPKSTTIMPSVTRPISATKTPTASYTGTAAMPTATEDVSLVQEVKQGAGSKAGVSFFGAAVGIVAGLLVYGEGA